MYDLWENMYRALSFSVLGAQHNEQRIFMGRHEEIMTKGRSPPDSRSSGINEPTATRVLAQANRGLYSTPKRGDCVSRTTRSRVDDDLSILDTLPMKMRNNLWDERY